MLCRKLLKALQRQMRQGFVLSPNADIAITDGFRLAGFSFSQLQPAVSGGIAFNCQFGSVTFTQDSDCAMADIR